MAENVTNGPLLETLRAIQAKLSDIASDVVDLKAVLRGLKGEAKTSASRENGRKGGRPRKPNAA
jgi:hypothetical protein